MEIDNFGTEFNLAEVYSNSIYKKKKKKKENTFQQSSANVDTASPYPCASHGASRFSGRKTEESWLLKNKQVPSFEQLGERAVNPEHKYSEIRLFLSNIREGRVQRVNAYLSIKEENDKKFTIFLRSSLTSALHETFRSISASSNQYLHECAEDCVAAHPNGLMLGRLRYTPKSGFVTDKHRKSLRSGLLGIYSDDTGLHATLYLLNEVYEFELTEDLTSKQKTYYEVGGIWSRDYGDMEEGEEF